MKYLLDTNICIALIRRKPAALIQRLIAHTSGEVGVSTVTVAELAHGAEKSAQPEQNLAALAQFLLPLEVAAFDQAAALAPWPATRAARTIRPDHWRHGPAHCRPRPRPGNHPGHQQPP